MPYRVPKEDKKLKCQFCNSRTNSIINYGGLYKLEDVVVHYYCVLLSTNMTQTGKDNEGIFGFLLTDIKAELKRSCTRKCFYCKKKKASIFCCHSKCTKVFHLPCSRKSLCLNQFSNQFQSFCYKHRPAQKIHPQILEETKKSKLMCPICYENFPDSQKPHNRLWAPCCGRAWFHRKCIQLLAYSAGYFFKCPVCNDTKKFGSAMPKLGIFIPQRDASWELEPNAYQDLLFRYNKCDAKDCRSPLGRERSIENSKWKIVLCQSCGSQGIHKQCGDLELTDSKWECNLCSKVGQKSQPTSNSSKSSESSVTHRSSSSRSKSKRKRSFTSDYKKDVQHKRRKTTGIDNSRERDDEENEGSDSEEEIDVLTVEGSESHQKTVLEAFSKLKPGPLSYKLNLIKNTFGSSFPAAQMLEEIELSSDTDFEGSVSNVELQRKPFEPEVIYLSDSNDGEEEKGADKGNSDVEIIEEPERLTDNITYCREKEKFDKATFSPGKELAKSTECLVIVSQPGTQVLGNLTQTHVESFSLFSLSVINSFEVVPSLNLISENNTEEVL